MRTLATGTGFVLEPTWAELIVSATGALGDRVLARWLVEEVAHASSAWLVCHGAEQAPHGASDRLADLVTRCRAGEPVQHVLGHWSFAGVELAVDRRALVPRPETEVLVEAVLRELDARTAAPLDPSGACLVLDLGTGSGAIACALVTANPGVEVVACDCASEALALASENRERLGASAQARLRLHLGAWYEGLDALKGQVDVVVSNPPYLARAEWAGLDPVVRDHDPYGALVAGESGLEGIDAVLSGAPAFLAPGGWAFVEIAPHQERAAIEIARRAGARRSEVALDLAGRPRVLRARF